MAILWNIFKKKIWVLKFLPRDISTPADNPHPQIHIQNQEKSYYPHIIRTESLQDFETRFWDKIFIRQEYDPKYKFVHTRRRILLIDQPVMIIDVLCNNWACSTPWFGWNYISWNSAFVRYYQSVIKIT